MVEADGRSNFLTGDTRRGGILLHPTSLPGSSGTGELGSHAYRWLDFLKAAGQRLWQVLPLGPTGYGDSPYQSFSSFAGNPLLISTELLVQDGWLEAAELKVLEALPRDHVDFGRLIPEKTRLLQLAARRFLQAGATPGFRQFVAAQADWLEDFVLFMALKTEHGGGVWTDWPAAERSREPAALQIARERNAAALEELRVQQFWFFSQWQALRSHAAERDIQIIGDLPIFVAMDSADTWAAQQLFDLDDDSRPLNVAGVPPDYFSATGQRWGNPLYLWDRHRADGYAWWIRRVRQSLQLFDRLRVDHFRGFEAYYSIPASEPTAVRGEWIRGPGQELFTALASALGELPLIAEDLGIITPAVEELRDRNSLPGMRVLQFAFGGNPRDPYLPHNHVPNSLVYTGTHDNDTTLGWYLSASEAERDLARRYLGAEDEDVPWLLLRWAFASVADMALVPLQDVLGLDSSARMNTPGKAGGNWSWRFDWEQPGNWAAPVLRDLSLIYGRLPAEQP